MRYDRERDVVEVSVEELCLSSMAGGNIDTSRNARRYSERSADHSRIYNKLHLSFGMRYYDRVELQNTCKIEDIYISVRGYADGVLCKDGGYSLDEVRVGKQDGFIAADEDQYHRIRANVYAYLLCSAKECDTLEVRHIFFDTEHGDFEVNPETKQRETLREIYRALLTKILWRAHVIRDREVVRIPSAANAVFPYRSLRESQGEMVKECYRDIKHGSRLFCQAPTGIGKTISTLYPAVKCVGEGVADRVFYLTSKQSIRREAFSAMQKMNAAGVGLRSCVISAREGMCNNAAAKLRGGRLSSSCNPELCPYAKGYYDRASYAIADLLANGDAYDSKRISEIAEKYKVCPYELSLDLSELCDVIICDYNYVFSPTVYLKRYFDGDRGEKYIFLVDEAHNLPDRARDMFSSRLSSNQLETLVSMLDKNDALTHAAISALGSFERLGRLCDNDTNYSPDGGRMGYSVSRQLPEKFSEELELFAKKCDTWLKHNKDHAAYLYIEDLGYKLYEHKKIVDRYGKGYLTFITREGAEVSILLYCLDPADELSHALDRAVASVMFSATLTPTDYFADILGGGKKTVSVSFRSPFPKENLCVAIVDKISTRYEDRESSYKRISSCIAGTVSARAGNYIVFFPSYSYLEEVKKIFTAKYPKVKILAQTKNMSHSDREEFIASFKDDGKTRIAFCVLGGSFSEGIDLPGDRLIGVICVGVGLPGLSNENNIIRDYYEEKSGCGYDYAYTYPGMNSILQAVGRVIRTEHDRGIAVLIDDRFAEPKYIAMFPDEWKDAKFAGNAQSLAQIAKTFWEKGK